MKTITMKDLETIHAQLKSNEVIVDVRTREEFAEGHVPGALNRPVDEIDQAASELKKYDQIFLHCRSGGRVKVAGAILESLGVTQISGVIQGGFPEWKK